MSKPFLDSEFTEDTESRISDLERSNHQLREDFRRLDAIIDEEGVARSCINPFEDLRLAIRKFKNEAKTLSEQNQSARQSYRELAEHHNKRCSCGGIY